MLTDLKIASVGPNRYRSGVVGAVDGDASLVQAAQDLRGGVAEAVPTHADDRHPWLHGVQQPAGGAPGRSMVPHLEQLHRLHRGGQHGFGGPARIAGEQSIEILVSKVNYQ